MQWVRHLAAIIWLMAFIAIILIATNLAIARVTQQMSGSIACVPR